MQPPVPPVSSDLNVREQWKMRGKDLPVLPALSRYHRPAPVLPVEGRYHRQCKISQNMSSAGFLPASTTGVSPVLPAVAGTTGQSPVLPVVQFLAKLRSRAGTAGTTGPEGRYYRLTLAEKKLSRSSCVQVCLSSARPKLT